VERVLSMMNHNGPAYSHPRRPGSDYAFLVPPGDPVAASVLSALQDTSEGAGRSYLAKLRFHIAQVSPSRADV
jgi:hypothetical protein